MKLSECLFTLMLFIIIVIICGVSFWYPLFKGAPECIFARDAITCTKVKMLGR